MTCYNPIEGWRARSANESGRKSLVFNSHAADVDDPLSVPCGRCIGCRGDQARDWGVRCYHEGLMYARNAFLTLTYGEAPEVGDSRDLSGFLKRLRNHGYKFRYFGCGEYGELSGRFHYHALIFGEDFRDGEYKINDSLYGNGIVDYLWGNGLVSIGSVTPESCFYVAGYCRKKIGQQAFSVMSRRPGIGKPFLHRHTDDLLASGTAVIGGREYPVPRKYFEWAYLDSVQDRRREYVRGLSADQRWEARCNARLLEEAAVLKQRDQRGIL